MKITLSLAGIPVEINTLFPDSLPTCYTDYITDKAPLFSVTISASDIERERQKSIAECRLEGTEYPGFTPPELESTAVYRKTAEILPSFGAFVFHGSAVAVNGKAFLFTAKSGTGKTTHTNLWLKNIPGSFIVNGDKPIIRVTDGGVYVCGTPWTGKEGLGKNVCVPLKALCVLSRGEQNSIQTVPFNSVMPKLIEQSYRPADGGQLVRTLSLIEKAAKELRFYSLFCNMSDEAALLSFNTMNNDEI